MTMFQVCDRAFILCTRDYLMCEPAAEADTACVDMIAFYVPRGDQTPDAYEAAVKLATDLHPKLKDLGLLRPGVQLLVNGRHDTQPVDARFEKLFKATKNDESLATRIINNFINGPSVRYTIK